ncbi:dethiobiotin synthetase [Apiospora arundinis]|uniref:Dethiobiotin synthetase n=1 Tax=Apiospora arundinis TaxID=335852 RepID=A0ABR2J5M8_9PEZI
MAHSGSLLWRNLRVYQIYGANTDVGKTIFTTALCNAASKLYSNDLTGYLKPVSTGPGDAADEQSQPHKTIPKDADLLSSIYSHLSDAAGSGTGNPGGWFFIETAGGVHSPGPSGTSQAELYRPLRCPVLLVGDAKLGGISTTISAFESLRLRGYDIEAVLLFEDEQFRNYDYLKSYFEKKHGVRVVSTPAPPLSESQGSQEDTERMARYYKEIVASGRVKSVLEHLDEQHKARVTRLESLSSQGYQRIWWPFTQQKLLSPAKITAIDSASGDFFQTLNTSSPEDLPEHQAKQAPASQKPLLQSSFDGSASWWTQGLGHANSSLTLAAAYAGGRYGHVMFAEAIHEPALALAETLLKGMRDGGNSRLSRVFYSDDGSTGVESALKMGLRAARTRYGWPVDTKLGIIGLEGAYHGDTIGAMDCADPSAYNEKVEWYEGKGVWFKPPSVMCRRGKWTVKIPAGFEGNGLALAGEMEAESLSDVFDFRAREARGEHRVYEAHVERVLKYHLDKGRKFGAIMMEPIILGAGGMVLVDPLFQRALVNVVRRSQHLFSPESVQQPRGETDWTGLPVIFDEVFTGLYRLGRFTASSFLGLDADVSIHAKLLTGGLVPLCATLASESIFQAFVSNDKTDALLHGHSYTAHPVGCQVALESLRQMQTMESSGSWAEFQNGVSGANDACWSIWSSPLVEWLSRHPSVAGVWALGSVMAIHLESPGGSGYTSTAAIALRDALRASNQGPAQNPWNVHSRVLGNVLYLMGGQKTEKDVVLQIERLLRQHLT